ncbi:MAG: hypothetical protein WCS70_13705 [Verrucomicrobiota bacterium]
MIAVVGLALALQCASALAEAVPGVKVTISELQPGTGTQYYAAPDGVVGNDGSKEKPWNLAEALVSKILKPGDTLWLRGGSYSCKSLDPRQRYPMVVCTLHGEKGKPIMIAQYPGERATLLGRLQIGTKWESASYVWFWNFEMASASKTRESKEAVSWPPSDLDLSGIDILDNCDVAGPGLKFIDMTVYDVNYSGMNVWHQAVDAEVNGCVVYYAGWIGPSGDRNHGHCVYTQNRYGIKTFRDNIFHKAFMFGTQIYGSDEAFVDGYDYIGNVVFNNGAIGGTPEAALIIAPKNCTQWHFDIEDNHLYNSDIGRWCAEYGWRFDKRKPYENITIKNNRHFGETALLWWKQVDVTGNLFCGKVDEEQLNGVGAKFDRAKNTFMSEKPTSGVEIYVRPSIYEANRANIIIYNWDKADAVKVDPKYFDGIVARGTDYVIRDPQNWFGPPIAKGTYDGKAISIPMKDLPIAEPIGIKSNKLMMHTAPEFGVFVIQEAKNMALK